MERGAAGDSRNEYPAKTARTVELFYLSSCSVLSQVALVDCCKSQLEKRCILCWCDCDPQLQNLNSCNVEPVVSAELLGFEIAHGFKWIQMLHVLKFNEIVLH